MKYCLFLTLFLICLKSFSQDYSASVKKYYECEHDLNGINSKIDVLNSEYEKIKKELAGGYYCNQCWRTKTQIEKDGTNFEQHLVDVKGVRVPATQKQFDDAHKSYMSKYNDFFNSFENKKSSCIKSIAELDKTAYDAAAKKIEINATKAKIQGISTQNNSLSMRENIQVSESVNSYLDSQTDISNSLTQTASEKMNNVNSLVNETTLEKVSHIDEMKEKIQSVKELITSTDKNTSFNLEDYDNITEPYEILRGSLEGRCQSMLKYNDAMFFDIDLTVSKDGAIAGVSILTKPRNKQIEDQISNLLMMAGKSFSPALKNGQPIEGTFKLKFDHIRIRTDVEIAESNRKSNEILIDEKDYEIGHKEFTSTLTNQLKSMYSDFKNNMNNSKGEFVQLKNKIKNFFNDPVSNLNFDSSDSNSIENDAIVQIENNSKNKFTLKGECYELISGKEAIIDGKKSLYAKKCDN